MILQAMRWQESSKIVTFFTEKEGLVKLIVRGALRKNNAYAGALEALNEVALVYYKKESRSLQIIKELDLLEDFGAIKQDFSRYPFALGIFELLVDVLEEGHGDAVFYGFVNEMMHGIARAAEPAIPFIFFIVKLASYMGFRPEFGQCYGGKESVCLLENNYFSLNNGKRVCTTCYNEGSILERLSRDEIFLLRNLQNTHFRRVKDTPFQCREWRHTVQVLLRYLSVQMERPVSLRALELIS